MRASHPWRALVKWTAIAVGCAVVGLGSQVPAPPLTLVATIPLPGVEGRIDHLSADVEGRRLFVAALGNNTVEAIDLAGLRVLRSVSGMSEPQGVKYLTDVGRIVVANGGAGTVQFLDGRTYGVTHTVKLPGDADNVRYDAEAKRIYVGYGDGALAVLGTDGTTLGNISVGGHPESFQLERQGSRVFVNVPAANRIAVIDRATMKLIAAWPVRTATANYPLALDESNHRLFVGCRRPALVLIYDTATGKQTAGFDIVGDTDDLFYDAARQRLYVSGGDGFLDVFRSQSASELTRIAHLATRAGARTSLFVPEQSRSYLAVPHRGNQHAEVRVYEAR